MFKALIAATAITVCCLGNDYPARSQSCHGTSYRGSYSGTCNDGHGGNYRYNGSGGSGRLTGTTGGGAFVNGNVNSSGGFSGTVGGQWVTCDRWGNCY
jgi:hypothetical protein